MDEPREPTGQDAPPQKSLPVWAKILLIVVLGIPIGILGLAGLVLGVCILGGR